MAQILVRNLTEEALKGLKTRAKRHNKSLEGEIREILEEVAKRETVDYAALLEEADRLRKSTEGRLQSDSAQLIREDRDR